MPLVGVGELPRAETVASQSHREARARQYRCEVRGERRQDGGEQNEQREPVADVNFAHGSQGVAGAGEGGQSLLVCPESDCLREHGHDEEHGREQYRPEQSTRDVPTGRVGFLTERSARLKPGPYKSEYAGGWSHCGRGRQSASRLTRACLQRGRRRDAGKWCSGRDRLNRIQQLRSWPGPGVGAVRRRHEAVGRVRPNGLSLTMVPERCFS
jgi:hypothetical protein